MAAAVTVLAYSLLLGLLLYLEDVGSTFVRSVYTSSHIPQDGTLLITLRKFRI
jgi:hypothetical protein